MRTAEVQSKMWSRRDNAMLVRTIKVRKCDVPDCEDTGWKYYFAGNVCFCSQHRHLAGEQS